MLDRASLLMIFTLLAGVCGFGDSESAAAAVARILFYVGLGFSILSLLLCLFEESDDARLNRAERSHDTKLGT